MIARRAQSGLAVARAAKVLRLQLGLAVATLVLLTGCAGSAPRDRSAEDARARILIRAGTAPPRPLPEEREPPEPEFSASDSALIHAGTLPVGRATVPEVAAPANTESGTAAPAENALDAQYRDAPALRVLSGRASYYHDSLAGRSTATGEPYNPRAYTCASRTLPFGTIVRVVRRDDESKRVVVRVNDRGPFGDASRLLDLSRAGAEALGTIQRGVADVRVEVLVLGDGPWGHGRVRRRGHRRARR